MADKPSQAWLDAHAKGRAGVPSWWCAQRGHLAGVARLLEEAGSADFYLLLDADTQVFPQALARLLTLLQHKVLQPDEDLYTGHLIAPWWIKLHQSSTLPVVPFIGTGGGCLLRGRTLRRLQSSGELARFRARQTSGDLRWAALDWTLGMALSSIDVPARGHPTFQQFAGSVVYEAGNESDGGGRGGGGGGRAEVGACPPAWVTCHQYSNLCQLTFRGWFRRSANTEQLIKRLCAPNGTDASVEAHEEAFLKAWPRMDQLRWASPCAVDVYGDSHSSYVSTCSLAIPGTWKSWKPCTDHWTNQTCSHAASRGKCRRPTFQKMCRRTCRQCDDTNKN